MAERANLINSIDKFQRRPAAISRVKLENFRCFQEFTLSVSATEPVVLTGVNGSGKTSVLEAISLFGTARGLRSARAHEMVGRKSTKQRIRLFDQASRTARKVRGGRLPGGTMTQLPAETTSGFKVQLAFSNYTDQLTIIQHPDGDKLRCIVNDQLQTTRQQLKQMMHILWLTPEYAQQLISGNLYRLKYIDRLASLFDSAHSGRLAAIQRDLRSRLVMLLTPRPDRYYLDVLEAEIARRIVAVVVQRVQVLQQLSAMMSAVPDPFPAGRIDLQGEVSEWLQQHDALATEQRIIEQLAINRSIDAEKMTVSNKLYNNAIVIFEARRGLELSTLSSGEQHAMLFSMYYASINIILHRLPGLPILLLDDIFAHLDQKRRAIIQETLVALPIGLWMSGVEAGLFSSLSGKSEMFVLD